MNLVDLVNKQHSNPNVDNLPHFKTGDTLAVHVKIKEGGKERIQVFEGICISMKRRGHINGHFCVRKLSSGFGVERIFPFHSPNIAKVEITAAGKARKSKLFYLKERTGKSARVTIDFSR